MFSLRSSQSLKVNMLNRRNVLGLATVAPLASALYGLPRIARAEEKQVIVGTYGGDYGELLRLNVDSSVASTKGIQAVQQIGALDRVTKLTAERQSRKGSFDVVSLTDAEMFTMNGLGVLQSVPEAKVPRLANVIPSLRKTYSVPHIYSAMVLLYNPQKVKIPPTSYADLWDPKFKGRVGFPDPLYAQMMAIASLVETGRPNDLEAAKKRMMALRSLDVHLYPSNEALAADIKSEEVWITPIWLARGVQWRNAGLPIAKSVPKEGALSVSFELAVPKNARNPDNGWDYLNEALRPEAQVEFAKKMGYLPTVSDAKLPGELAKEIDLSAADRAKLVPTDYKFIQQNGLEMSDFWNKQFKA
ncbi:ABC transporter substrate-binding protein [Variovorax rhizosphaerae]|uniref:Extracellular solute-binding protein n=1 Tax=Variovorax rhizosphaerae TaxID=1836200 RepID=A0ABU8WU83_9BURK